MRTEGNLLFEVSTGWSGPISLTVTDHVSNCKRHLQLQCPYALIGRSSKCDITLKQQQVGYRHAYLQVIDGRVFCVDLATRTGTHWEDGTKKAGWLEPDHTIRIGEYSIQLTPEDDSIRHPSSVFPGGFCPLQRYRGEIGALPKVDPLFSDAQDQQLTVPCIRMITLVGRDPVCKFQLIDESVSKIHTSLLNTASGLWAIDLQGRGGTRLNSKQIRHAHVQDDDDLKIGRYHMRVRYPTTAGGSALDEDEPSCGSNQATSSTTVIASDKVFMVETVRDTLIVTPRRDARHFRYEDFHCEANKLRDLLATQQLTNLVIDLGNERIYSATMITLFVKLLNTVVERSGRVGVCNASPTMQQTLHDMKLYKLWLHFHSREEALQSLTS